MDNKRERLEFLRKKKRLAELREKKAQQKQEVTPEGLHPDLYAAVDKAKEYGMNALDGAGRVLDFAGGNIRTAGADALDELFGSGDLVKKEEYLKALEGKALSSDQLIEKAGGEDSYTNAALGLGLDIATDPLTYLTLGASSLGKLGKLTRLAEKPTKELGRMIHATPFRKLNKAANDYNRMNGGSSTLPTDIMFENNMWGRAGKIDEQAMNHLRNIRDRRNKITSDYQNVAVNPDDIRAPIKSKVDELEAGVDTVGERSQAAISGRSELDKLNEIVNGTTRSRNGNLTRPGQMLKADEVVAPKTITVMDANKGRVDLNSQLDANFKAEQNGSKLYTDHDASIMKAKRQGLSDAQVNALNAQDPGLGDDFLKMGQEQGALLSGAKGLGQDVSRLENLSSVSQVDAMLAGAGDQGLKALALKKLLQIAQGTPVATGSGVLLKKGAESGANDILLRELLKVQNRE